MFNFLKLLTEEPEKLERLIILFLKLLISLWIPCYLFDVDIKLNFGEINSGKTFSEYSIAKILYFVSAIIIVWFILWELGKFLVLGLIYLLSFIIKSILKLLSKKFSSENLFKSILIFFGVINEKGIPEHNVLSFLEFLKSMDNSKEDMFEVASSRTVQYWLVAVVIYILLTLSKEVSFFYTIDVIIISLLTLSLLNTIAINLIGKYIYSKLPKLIKAFKEISYYYKVKVALEEKLTFGYTINFKKKIIELIKKENYMPNPRLEIIPIYFHNYNLGNKILTEYIESQNDFEGYKVFISNIKPDYLKSTVSKKNNIIYIYGDKLIDINNRIEELFYIIRSKHKYTQEFLNNSPSEEN